MTQREQSHRLVLAFRRRDKAQTELEAAQRALDDAFFPWAAGRSISRTTAREQLVSTGYLS